MIINSKTAIFKYDGETSFNLLDPSKNIKSLSEYNKFINNVLYIYGQTKTDGSIPIFFTKIIPSTTYREADPNSTLITLDPGKTYYITLVSEQNLPISIPYNINSEEFLSNKNCDNLSACQEYNTCHGNPNISNKNYRNVVLTKDYSYDINLVVENLYPSHKYYYEITPVYSNWPAKLSSLSGFVEGSKTLNNDGNAEGIIKSLFSYYPSGDNYTNSINYDSNIDIQSNTYYKNIFTILNLSIYSENMELLFSDQMDIRCNGCLPNKNREKPIFKLSNEKGSFSDVNEILCTGTKSIFINYSGLDPSKVYSFGFFSVASNWPAKISPKTQEIKPEILYVDSESNMVYGSGSIETYFKFSPVYNPFGSWPNLQYNLESFYKEKFIENNIYNILSLSIDESSENIYKDSIIVRGNIKSENEDCIDSLYVKFDDTNNIYPSGGLTENNRPGSEINLSNKLCCNQDQILTATISGACCGKEYNYRLYNSNPLVSITPLSGTIAFGDGTGKIAAIYNLNNRPGTTVRLVISDPVNNVYAVDNIILRCPNKVPVLPPT